MGASPALHQWGAGISGSEPFAETLFDAKASASDQCQRSCRSNPHGAPYLSLREYRGTISSISRSEACTEATTRGWRITSSRAEKEARVCLLEIGMMVDVSICGRIAPEHIELKGGTCLWMDDRSKMADQTFCNDSMASPTLLMIGASSSNCCVSHLRQLLKPVNKTY